MLCRNRKHREIARLSRALPNHSPELLRYWDLPSFLRKRDSVQRLVGKIVATARDGLGELRFPTGDRICYPPGPAAVRYGAVSLYFTVTYLGQYFQHVRPQPGETVLDIGANLGCFSLAASRAVGPGGRVYCCEPVSANVRALQGTIAANGLTNCTVVPLAVGDASGTLSIHLQASSGGHTAVLAEDGEVVEVGKTTVDELVAQQGIARVHFVKVDVEGMEAHVLRGAAETLRRDAPTLVVSGYHRPEDRTELPRLLRELQPAYRVEFAEPLWGELDIVARC